MHQKFASLFLSEATASARTGEPILRPLDFEFPGCGYESIKDQFLIGRTLLVAPVLRPAIQNRSVSIPPGTWVDDLGATVTGPRVIEITTPLNRLPYWKLV